MPTPDAQPTPSLPAHWPRRLGAAVLAAVALAAYGVWVSAAPLHGLLLGALAAPIALLCVWAEASCHAPALRTTTRGPHDLPGPPLATILLLALAATGLLQLITAAYLLGAVAGTTTPGDLRDAAVLLALPAMALIWSVGRDGVRQALAALAAALAAWMRACLPCPSPRVPTLLPADTPPAPRRVDATRIHPTRAPPLA